jgi:uridine phosphorylase
MPILPSELILNNDGSIYHLNLRPEQVAQTIITVGDPERVQQVSRHFDFVEYKIARREFHTHTGQLRGKRITVISTGIGTDNIDIVFNELDALFNVDFETREVKTEQTQLDFIRIGTSGAVQPDIPLDSILISTRAIGFDSLLHWYENEQFLALNTDFSNAVKTQLNIPDQFSVPYVVDCDKDLAKKFQTMEILNGNTITNVGFYGPQSRSIRLKPAIENLKQSITDFDYNGQRLTNLEMETSGIYAMSKLLGHRAVSLNAILANRATGEFSKHPDQTVENLISFVLTQLTA